MENQQRGALDPEKEEQPQNTQHILRQKDVKVVKLGFYSAAVALKKKKILFTRCFLSRTMMRKLFKKTQNLQSTQNVF